MANLYKGYFIIKGKFPHLDKFSYVLVSAETQYQAIQKVTKYCADYDGEIEAIGLDEVKDSFFIDKYYLII